MINPENKERFHKYSAGHEYMEDYGEGDSSEKDNIAEKLRPSEEVVTMGKSYLDEEIHNKITELYSGIYEKRKNLGLKDEIIEFPKDTTKEVKAYHIKKFLNENPKKEKEIISGLSDGEKKNYDKLMDYAEINSSLDDGEMKVETPFLLIKYLKDKYNIIEKEKNTYEEGSIQREQKDKELEKIFNAQVEIVEKVSDKNFKEEALEETKKELGEKEQYIKEEEKNERRKEQASERIKEKIFERNWKENWEALSSEQRNDKYGNRKDNFIEQKLMEIEGMFRGAGEELVIDREELLSLLQRYHAKDISLEKEGLFKRKNIVKLGSRKLSSEEFSEFVKNEKDNFIEDLEEEAGKIGKEEWEGKQKEKLKEKVKEMKGMSEKEVKKACNKMREEKMNKFWEGKAKEVKTKEEIEKIKEKYEDSDSFNIAEILEETTEVEKKLEGNLKDDAEDIWEIINKYTKEDLPNNTNEHDYIKRIMGNAEKEYKKKGEKNPNLVRFVLSLLFKLPRNTNENPETLTNTNENLETPTDTPETSKQELITNPILFDLYEYANDVNRKKKSFEETKETAGIISSKLLNLGVIELSPDKSKLREAYDLAHKIENHYTDKDLAKSAMEKISNLIKESDGFGEAVRKWGINNMWKK